MLGLGVNCVFLHDEMYLLTDTFDCVPCVKLWKTPLGSSSGVRMFGTPKTDRTKTDPSLTHMKLVSLCLIKHWHWIWDMTCNELTVIANTVRMPNKIWRLQILVTQILYYVLLFCILYSTFQSCEICVLSLALIRNETFTVALPPGSSYAEITSHTDCLWQLWQSRTCGTLFSAQKTNINISGEATGTTEYTMFFLYSVLVLP